MDIGARFVIAHNYAFLNKPGKLLRMRISQFLFVCAAMVPGLTLASPACPDQNTCITALLASAKAGEHANEVAQMARLTSLAPDWQESKKKKQKARPETGTEATGVGAPAAALTSVLQNAKQDFGLMPAYRRALTLQYLQQKQYHAAEDEAKEAIRLQPYYAPLWTDLAAVFMAKGQGDDAVAALLIAHNWAGNPAAMREAYVQAAQASDSAVVFKQAVELADQHAARLAQAEAASPALIIGAKDPATGKKVARPGIASFPKPSWPLASLHYEETGKVTLAFLVDADGKLQRAKKLKSSGYVELDNAALLALASGEFTPAEEDGKPVAAWMVMQYVWTLE